MAKRLECWTCNLEDPSSSSTLTASWICFTENLTFKSSATLVNSQLVHLWSAGVLNPVMFILYVYLNIYSMALKSPNGELSLEIVFFVLYSDISIEERGKQVYLSVFVNKIYLFYVIKKGIGGL